MEENEIYKNWLKSVSVSDNDYRRAEKFPDGFPLSELIINAALEAATASAAGLWKADLGILPDFDRDAVIASVKGLISAGYNQDNLADPRLRHIELDMPKRYGPGTVFEALRVWYGATESAFELRKVGNEIYRAIDDTVTKEYERLNVYVRPEVPLDPFAAEAFDAKIADRIKAVLKADRFPVDRLTATATPLEFRGELLDDLDNHTDAVRRRIKEFLIETVDEREKIGLRTLYPSVVTKTFLKRLDTETREIMYLQGRFPKLENGQTLESVRAAIKETEARLEKEESLHDRLSAGMGHSPGIPDTTAALRKELSMLRALERRYPQVADAPGDGTTEEKTGKEKAVVSTIRNDKGDLLTYDANEPVPMTERQLSDLNDIRLLTGMPVLTGNVTKEDVMTSLDRFRGIIVPKFTNHELSAPQMEALSRALFCSGIWNALDMLDGKATGTSVDDSGKEFNLSYFGGRDALTGLHSDIERVVNAADREMTAFEAHGWRERWSILDYITGTRHNPSFPLPDKDTLDMLRKEGHLTGDRFYMNPEEGLAILKTIPVIRDIPEDILERITGVADTESIDPLSVSKVIRSELFLTVPAESIREEDLLQETLADATSLKEQLEATGRYEGYLKKGDSYIIIERGEDGSVLYADCKEILKGFNDTLKADKTDTLMLTIDGRNYEFTAKELGEIAFGRTVEVKRKETGEYASFAYDIKEGKIATSESFENRLKADLCRKESESVKESVKESLEKTAEESISKGTGKGIK